MLEKQQISHENRLEAIDLYHGDREGYEDLEQSLMRHTMSTSVLHFKSYSPAFIKLFGEKVIMSTDDNKAISVFDLHTLNLVQNIELGTFAHSMQLVNGRLVVSGFDGSIVDIYGINQRRMATCLNKVQSLDTCSPIYCVHVVEKLGLLLTGQIDGFVDVLEAKEYRSVHQTQVPLEAAAR